MQMFLFSFRLPRISAFDSLQKAQAKIIERWEDLGFHPVVDKDFFIEHPYDTLDYSDFLGNHKELIIGTNANDGALFLTGGKRSPYFVVLNTQLAIC